MGSRLVTLGFVRGLRVREMVSRPHTWAAALVVPLPYLGAGNTGAVKTRRTLASSAPPDGGLLEERRRRRSEAWPRPGVAQSHSWRRPAPGKQKDSEWGFLYYVTHPSRS